MITIQDRIRLFSTLRFEEKNFKAGDRVNIQIMRVGKWNHALYGKVEVTHKTIQDVVTNFHERKRGIDLAVDENHEPNHKALGWFKDLYLKGKDALFATVELTKKGADLLTEGAYKYFSPELVFKKADEETGKTIQNLLIGGAFTNRPFFKAMQPLMATEEATGQLPKQKDSFTESSQPLLFFNSSEMKTILDLIGQFAELEVITTDQKDQLEKAFIALPESDRTPELKKAYDECLAKFNDSTPADSKGEDDTEESSEDLSSEALAQDDDSTDDTTDSSKENSTEEIKASESEEVTIKASELETLKNMASQTAKLVRQARKAELSRRVHSLSFTESNPKGLILPKSQDKFVNFALSLSEHQADKFLGLMHELQKLSASELGHSNDTPPQPDPDKIKFFMDKLHLTQEEAVEAYNAYEKTATF